MMVSNWPPAGSVPGGPPPDRSRSLLDEPLTYGNAAELDGLMGWRGGAAQEAP